MSGFAIFGIDVGDLVADLLRALLDLLVPDFAAKWGSQLATWLVALPDVTDSRQFGQLNRFRVDLTHAVWGLLSLSFAVGGLQYWAAGFAEASRASAFDAVRRTVVAAGALAAYPTLIAQLVLGVNQLTAALIRHPRVVDGLDVALGGAFALGAVSGGLSLGPGLAAVVAAVFFLAALLVMTIALTAMLCVLAVSGALVIALYPLPLEDSLARLWLAGLVCAVAVPVSWALIFAVAGLVSADALSWTGGLGGGMAALVKPFVAVACLYLAYRSPALLVAQARMMGLRLDLAAGSRVRGSPGEQRLRAAASRQGAAYHDRFAGLGGAAARPAAAAMARAGGLAARQTGAAGRTVRRVAAAGAVSAAAAAGGNVRRGERVVAGVNAAAGAAPGQRGPRARPGGPHATRTTGGGGRRGRANGGHLRPRAPDRRQRALVQSARRQQGRAGWLSAAWSAAGSSFAHRLSPGQGRHPPGARGSRATAYRRCGSCRSSRRRRARAVIPTRRRPMCDRCRWHPAASACISRRGASRARC